MRLELQKQSGKFDKLIEVQFPLNSNKSIKKNPNEFGIKISHSHMYHNDSVLAWDCLSIEWGFGCKYEGGIKPILLPSYWNANPNPDKVVPENTCAVAQ